MSHPPAAGAVSPPPALPVVVQIGFAGSRALFDPADHPEVDARAFHAAVLAHLTARLVGLREKFHLSERHFFCGISSLAIGADTIFAQACQALGWPQRLCLPQSRDEFLVAHGAGGAPDFSPADLAVAKALFASPHVIHERVVSESADRHTRFSEVNLELVRVSDVMVCLVEATAAGKPGGTREVIDDARNRRRPLLEIRVTVGADGQPHFDEQWHHEGRFVAPSLPPELAELKTDLTGIPSVVAYCDPLKKFASRTAKWRQALFQLSALVIIGTHLLATLCAVVALKEEDPHVMSWYLGGELVLLALGFGTHLRLHGSHAVRVWAMARLVAEIARSSVALREVPGYLGFFFSLPLPESARALLRTLNVLHSREDRATGEEDWAVRRDRYVDTRLTRKGSGQIPYYKEKLRGAAGWQLGANRTFIIGSILAFAATAVKLALVIEDPHHHPPSLLGMLAVVLPVMAVAAVSFAAALDVEARVHVYREMLVFLWQQRRNLRHTASESGFHSLALETEARLLGETASWYSRRAFTGVA